MSSRRTIAALLAAAVLVAAVLIAASHRQVKRAAVSACASTVTPSMPASAIAGDIVGAGDGSTVCLAGGSYPFVHVVGAAHAAYVTVRPAPGATVAVAGMEVENSSFLRFQGLHMTAGFNMRDASSHVGSHDYQFVEDTIENAAYGIVLYGGLGPIRKVLIERVYMRNIDFPGEACSAGYAGGQGVTLYYAEGVTIAHSTFKEVSWHYIQGGSAGPGGVRVEHDLFEGPIQANRLVCTHLNVWQIYQGGEDDTFSNNVVRGEPGKPAAVTPLMFETGAGGAECGFTMTNTVVTNNLFVYASTAYVSQILTTKNLTYSHNTVVGGEYGTWLDRSDSCGAGSNLTAEHNISVKAQGNGAPQRFVFGACSGVCRFDYNVSDDSTANALGSTHYLLDWSPTWTTSAWNRTSEPTPPAGYYRPMGLPFTAGYEHIPGQLGYDRERAARPRL